MAHGLLWAWCNAREGVWLQRPATDQAHDLTSAWLLYAPLRALDLPAALRAWVVASPVHPPFVPLVSALLMLVFGASRLAAEAALPLFTVVWLLSIYAVFRRLADARTAVWTAALSSTFAVFLIYSRTYLMEHPLAAMFALGCWALVASDAFSRTGPTIAFGVCAGLAFVTRGGGPAYFCGPLAVAFVAAARRGDRLPCLTRGALALVVAAAIAGTWYVPNARAVVGYMYRATYGIDAVWRIGTVRPFSWANASYYAQWIVAQGPGVPLALLAIASGIAGLAGAGGRRPSHVSLALLAVFAIDFVVLLVAAQHESARYFQPLMPIVAYFIVRAVQSIPLVRLRAGVAVVAVLLSAHHVYGTTFADRTSRELTVAYYRGLPLWDHEPYFPDLLRYYAIEDPATDFRLPETLDLIGRQHPAPGATITVVQRPHPFFQPNGLRLEAVRRHLPWRFVWVPFADGRNAAEVSRAIDAMPVDFVLVQIAPYDAAGTPAPALPALSRYSRVPDALTLGDGSVVTLYVRGHPRDAAGPR